MKDLARSAQPIPIPRDLARERSVLLHRALRELPLPLLKPLLAGLRRYADDLVCGSLSTADGGGCAVGMMLREIAERPVLLAGDMPPPAPTLAERLVPRRLRFHSPTIREARPDLAKANPRLAHLELIFDVTCNALREEAGIEACDAARSVGLWMAAETQAEVNLRHVELEAEDPGATLGLPAVALDERLFHNTVGRLRQLRPWLSEGQASRLLEMWVGARRLEIDPLFVPDDWATEVRLQRERLEVAAAR